MMHSNPSYSAAARDSSLIPRDTHLAEVLHEPLGCVALIYEPLRQRQVDLGILNAWPPAARCMDVHNAVPCTPRFLQPSETFIDLVQPLMESLKPKWHGSHAGPHHLQGQLVPLAAAVLARAEPSKSKGVAHQRSMTGARGVSPVRRRNSASMVAPDSFPLLKVRCRYCEPSSAVCWSAKTPSNLKVLAACCRLGLSGRGSPEQEVHMLSWGITMAQDAHYTGSKQRAQGQCICRSMHMQRSRPG